ncbi:non-functional NADPH-dependent codeinone reductase 2-like isoform X2 [Quercus robur]|uniref:non-functional NADPH-dependent codeinone reductase 2-like isoform X2 n=1 Tax=Quercus robur TaxID=38942 RepID=UPI002163A02D|nr:non-functional NADPH-dependent codeinone reductase 2-like isoform X2 [Quercus robur]
MAATTLNSVTKIPKMELSSSSGPVSMPVIGFGTAADNNDGATLISAVLESIKLGYRHFDTASAYGSEQALGEAIAEALRLGLIPSRDDLFVTSKLWPTEAHAHLVLPSLQKSLRTLQLEYLDLYLIHWPITVTPGKGESPFDKQDLMPMDFKSVWAAMEECQRLGLTKSIGVSNFSCKKLENLLSFATIPPSVNQVEMNPVWQQNKLTEFCKANGIIVTAFSPLGAKGVSWGTNDVMDNEVLKEIAKTRGKTVAQVCLRWIYEQGAALIVKSYNKERLKENLQIFDWELSEDDYDKIGQIKQHRMMLQEELVSAHGPYKSIEELWDGEL